VVSSVGASVVTVSMVSTAGFLVHAVPRTTAAAMAAAAMMNECFFMICLLLCCMIHGVVFMHLTEA